MQNANINEKKKMNNGLKEEELEKIKQNKKGTLKKRNPRKKVKNENI